MVRLVKGAYWDSEIKRSQERGLDGYPVFTRKVVDRRLLSRLRQAAARPSRRLLSAIRDPQCPYGGGRSWCWPATAAISSSSACTAWARRSTSRSSAPEQMDRPCRIYAPVGSHEDLLAYLVRRLLENGANTSFVNRIVDDEQPIDEIIADPVARLAPAAGKAASAHPAAARPLRPARQNSRGLDLTDPRRWRALARRRCRGARGGRGRAAPLIGGVEQTGAGRAGARSEPTGGGRSASVVEAGPDATSSRRSTARGAAQPAWDRTPADERAAMSGARRRSLREPHRAELMALVIREAGKTIPDALSRGARGGRFPALLRAARAGRFRRPPSGCPARPASATRSRCTGAASSPASRRGIFRWRSSPARSRRRSPPATRSSPSPPSRRRWSPPRRCGCCTRPASRAMCCTCCRATGEAVGAPLVADPRIAGVAFTGSTETARRINRALARAPRADRAADRRDRRAECDDRRFLGAARAGRRAMSLTSAFDSAGQRCSALRLLYRPGRHRRPAPGDAGGRDGRARGRRSGAARDRCRPGHRRGGAGGAGAPCRADGARGPAALSVPPAARHRARHLLRAPRLRDRQRGAARARGVRPDPACRALAGRPARRGARRDRRDRLRPDPRHPQPDRRDGAPHPRAGCASATATSTAT